MDKELYKILGVTEKASAKEIKDSYRELAKKYHPDKNRDNPKAAERFKEVSAAYEVLKDPEKRKKYDHMRNNPFAGYQGNGGQYGFGEDFGDLNDVLSQIFGGSRSKRKSSTFGGFNNYNNSGSTPGFGGFNGRRQRSDTVQKLKLPLSTLIKGGKIEITTPLKNKIKIDIKPGIANGHKIKINDQAQRGDLILEIVALPDRKYYFEGNNLVQKEEITFFEALFGKKISISTPAGKRVKLSIPPMSDAGKRFKIPNLGFDSKGNPGSLYIELQLVLPGDLTKEQLTLLKNARNL